MKELKTKLYNRALEKYPELELCPTVKEFDESFTVFKNQLVFWFNVGDDTFAIKEEIK